jgi:hypothetical protein
MSDAQKTFDGNLAFEREQIIKRAVNKSRMECHDNIRTLNPDRDLRWDNEEAFDRMDRDYDRD